MKRHFPMKRKTPLRKRRKGELSRLVERLDRLCAQVVKARDGWRCQKCGAEVSGRDAHCAHVVGKGGGGFLLRWDLLNMVTLCFHHHIQWAHLHPLDFEVWFTDTFPARRQYLDRRRDEANTPEAKQDARLETEKDKIEKRRLLIEQLERKLLELRE